MLLFEVLQPNAPVYHMTTVNAAISILQSKHFKLVRNNGEDDAEDPTGMYHMSVARSTNSEFMNMMGGHGAVIFVLNKNRLQSNNKVVPYQSADAADEMSGQGYGDGDEMEDRVYSRTPILAVRGPLNNTVLQVRLLGGMARAKGGSADFTTEQMQSLQKLCQVNHIPFGVWDTDNEQGFKMGRNGY